MLRVLEPFLRKWDSRRYRRNVKRALALHLRGEVRKDGLMLASVTTHMEIEWRARDIHPWDRPLLSQSERAATFVSQTLADTEAAVHRLFEALPQVDVIALRVLDPVAETVIISGAVTRPAALHRDERLSIGMRLLYLGLTYHSAGALFEPLEQDQYPAIPADAGHAFRSEGVFAKAMYRRD